MLRHLGYACVNQTLRGKGKNQVFTSRGLTLRTFTISKAADLALQNCLDLIKILEWNLKNNILFFRVGSDLFPFATHPDVGYSIDKLETYNQIVAALNEAGNFAKKHGMRLNSHPGPTTLLASPQPNVIDNAIRDIELHCLVGELMGLTEIDNDSPFTVNFHVGGPYGDKISTAKRFCENFKRLSPLAQRSITVENDDKDSQYSVSDLHSLIYNEVGIPIVFDYHHHTFNTGNITALEAAALAFSTWGNKIPDIHYSEPRDNQTPTAHADYCESLIPLFSSTIQYDVMLEAKAKELALLKYRQLYESKKQN